MPRVIWVKPQSDPNGAWTRYEGEPPFTVPAVGGQAYEVCTDSGESFVVSPEVSDVAPTFSGIPLITGTPEVGQTLTATAAQATGTTPIATTWQWLRDGVELLGADTPSYLLTASDEGTSIAVRQTASNNVGSESVTSSPIVLETAPPLGDAAVITELTVADQNAAGEVAIAYVIDSDSDVTGVLTTSATAPTAAQIAAGQDDTDAEAADAFSDRWTTSGDDSLANISSGLASGTYYVHVLPNGGGDIDVVSSNGFTLETVAPTVTAAQASADGATVTLALSEAVSGTADAANWEVYSDGIALGVASVAAIDAATSIVLELTTAVPSSAGEITFDYTPGDIADAVSNPLAAISGNGIARSISTYSENTVTVTSGTYLTGSALPTTAKAILTFFSGTATTDASRTALVSWGGVNGGIYTNATAGNGVVGWRARLTTDAGGTLQNDSETIAPGTRYHGIWSAWSDGIDFHSIGYVYNTEVGEWQEAWNITDPEGAGNLILGPDNLTLFRRSDSTNHNHEGDINRLALWTSTTEAAIADIVDPAVRGAFIDGASIADPAATRSAYATHTRHVDLIGDVTEYNDSVSGGTMTFTRSGTFS